MVTLMSSAEYFFVALWVPLTTAQPPLRSSMRNVCYFHLHKSQHNSSSFSESGIPLTHLITEPNFINSSQSELPLSFLSHPPTTSFAKPSPPFLQNVSFKPSTFFFCFVFYLQSQVGLTAGEIYLQILKASSFIDSHGLYLSTMFRSEPPPRWSALADDIIYLPFNKTVAVDQ